MRFGSTIVIVALAAAVAGCKGNPGNPNAPTPGQNVAFSTTDLRVGTGAEATNGRVVSANYTGWLYDAGAVENKGRQFDSNSGRGPFSFTLGTGQVIAGWDRGILGMRVGGMRRLVIPPNLGYGSTGAGNGVIPPNATLVFDVELVAVQ